MANELNISLIELAYRYEPHFALIQLDKAKPEIWVGHTSLCSHPAELNDLVKVIRRHAKRKCPAEFKATFYLDKIEEVAQNTPIYFEPELEHDGTAGESRDQEEPATLYERNAICIKTRYNLSTLLHEILHLCTDIPLKYHWGYSSEEEAIELATEFVIQKDREIFQKIEKASVRGTIARFNLENTARSDLERRLNDYQNSRWNYKRDNPIKRIAKYFFLGELKNRLPTAPPTSFALKLNH